MGGRDEVSWNLVFVEIAVSKAVIFYGDLSSGFERCSVSTLLTGCIALTYEASTERHRNSMAAQLSNSLLKSCRGGMVCQ